MIPIGATVTDRRGRFVSMLLHPTQKVSTMHQGISNTPDQGLAQAQQPEKPLDHFNDVWLRLDARIRSLEALADQLIDGPTPKGETGQQTREQVLSVRQVVREFPSEMGNMADRIDSVVDRLQGNLLGN